MIHQTVLSENLLCKVSALFKNKDSLSEVSSSMLFKDKHKTHQILVHATQPVLIIKINAVLKLIKLQVRVLFYLINYV